MQSEGNYMKKSKKIIVSVLLVVALAGAFGLGFLTKTFSMSADSRAAVNLIEKYKKYYLFEEDGVIDKISDALLDDYSGYQSKQTYENIQDSAKGSSAGIGVQINRETLEITRVLGNSPAEKAGVKEGGIVVRYDVGAGEKRADSAAEFLNDLDAVSSDKTFVLTLSYGGDEVSYNLKKSNYTRTYVKFGDDSGYYSFLSDGDEISVAKLSDEAYLSDPSAFYIRYDSFSGTKSGIEGSVGQLKTALDKMKERGKTHLVLDLRGNGGGYMSILTEVAALLTPTSESKFLIGYAENKRGNRSEFYGKNPSFYSYGIEKFSVLGDSGTASASEALIGALLDYADKSGYGGLTVYVEGSNGVYKTYGKGIMQSTFKNADGSAVKLTTDKLYFPLSGISIHGTGVTEKTSPRVKSAETGAALAAALG